MRTRQLRVGFCYNLRADFPREPDSPADIDLDWRELNALPYEARIRRLARWVDEAERDGRRYRLVLPGQPPLGPAQGSAHRHACLKALALMPAGSPLPLRETQGEAGRG